MTEIDLHVHTTASDGTDSPSGAVKLAAELGLRAVAITDHDTCMGVREAVQSGRELGIEVVPGIEISNRYSYSVHVLGYYINPGEPRFAATLDSIIENRDSRNRAIAELMQEDGLPVSYDEMARRFGGVLGRPHFAMVLVELGLAADVKDAFQRYVDKGCKYWLPRKSLKYADVIQIISQAGGVPVLAHPFQYKQDDKGLRELIEVGIDNGLQGIECRYSGYDKNQVAYLERLAGEYGLVKTCGSDYHGQNKKYISLGQGTKGELYAPYSWLEELKEKAGI